VYGLHVAAIYRAIDHYAAEVREGGQRVYCPGCGYLSRAASVGGFYCEVCGSTLSTARQTARFPLPMPQVQALYGENIHRPCPNCQARIGYYNGHCLRCGYELGR
jgi:predicted amidophosphoribosyltransferase